MNQQIKQCNDDCDNRINEIEEEQIFCAFYDQWRNKKTECYGNCEHEESI